MSDLDFLEVFNAAGTELLKNELREPPKPKLRSRFPKTAGNDTVAWTDEDKDESLKRAVSENTAVLKRLEQ